MIKRLQITVRQNCNNPIYWVSHFFDVIASNYGHDVEAAITTFKNDLGIEYSLLAKCFPALQHRDPSRRNIKYNKTCWGDLKIAFLICIIVDASIKLNWLSGEVYCWIEDEVLEIHGPSQLIERLKQEIIESFDLDSREL